MDWLIAKAQPAFLVVPNGSACPFTGTTKLVLQYGDNESLYPGKPLTEGELEPLYPDELAIIMFTSGTTGMPKGVCQTLACISANAGNVALALGINGTDRIFINTPPYFTSGICHFLTLLAAGGGVAGELGFFFGDSLLDMMEKLGCTGFGGDRRTSSALSSRCQPRESTISVSGLVPATTCRRRWPRNCVAYCPECVCLICMA